MDKICDSADLTTDMIGVSPKLSRYTPTPRSILFERTSSLYSEIIFKIGSGGINDNFSNKVSFSGRLVRLILSLIYENIFCILSFNYMNNDYTVNTIF